MMDKKRIIIFSLVIVLLLACLAGMFLIGFYAGGKTAYCVEKPDQINFSLFWDAYSKLSKNFVDPLKITDENILYGAIDGMAKSLGDPYTAFFNPKEAQRFNQDLQGSFDGIGAEIGIKKNLLTIIAPLDGTPAQKAGLKAGDIIVEIDEKDTADMTSDEAVDLIRGPAGTAVTLKIFREDWSVAKDFKIVRDTIKVSSIKWGLKDNNVAYIKISQFDESLPSDFQNIISAISLTPAEKIVLDLRNNPGGYLEVAQTIAGWFLKNGQTVAIEDYGKGKEPTIYTTHGNAQLANMPAVVLINEGSASASEILAGALRDNRGVKLVGTKSFGKGSVQEVLDLYGGSFLKITVARWLTPDGQSISEVGLAPDVKIDITDQDIEQNKDPQLDKALEIIKDLK